MANGEEKKPDDAGQPPASPGRTNAFANLLNPVPFIALVILLGVMFLLAMAIFGWDRGKVLLTMAQPEFARGLITYLFTIVTIGTAVVLIISGLTGGSKEQFDRGKEILGLLLGVFGTMVGFYFGSEASHVRLRLSLTPPLLSATEIVTGERLTVTAMVQGGAPPYRLGISTGENPPGTYDQAPRGDGWIVSTIVGPEVSKETAGTIWIAVQDGNGDLATAKSTFTEKPRPAQ